MDVKKGNPGSIFQWFFDKKQSVDGTNKKSEVMILLLGTSESLSRLTRLCLANEPRVNASLGEEVLLLFFEPEISAQMMAEDGRSLQEKIQREVKAQAVRTSPVKFAYCQNAYALPDHLATFGKGDFRSEESNGMHFRELSSAVSWSNASAFVFFREMFKLQSQRDYVLVAHRKKEEIRLYELGNEHYLTLETVCELLCTIRTVTESLSRIDKIQSIELAADAAIFKGNMLAPLCSTWNKLKTAMQKVGQVEAVALNN